MHYCYTPVRIKEVLTLAIDRLMRYELLIPKIYDEHWFFVLPFNANLNSTSMKSTITTFLNAFLESFSIRQKDVITRHSLINCIRTPYSARLFKFIVVRALERSASKLLSIAVRWCLNAVSWSLCVSHLPGILRWRATTQVTSSLCCTSLMNRSI